MAWQTLWDGWVLDLKLLSRSVIVFVDLSVHVGD